MLSTCSWLGGGSELCVEHVIQSVSDCSPFPPQAISEMYAILASEILGYNVVQYPSPSTMANLHYLSGCDGVSR